MEAALSFGGVIFDSSGIRGKLNASFSNFTGPEALNGWPFFITLEARAGSESGVTIETQTFTDLAKPSNPNFAFGFNFSSIPVGTTTVGLVANAINSVFQTPIGHGTKTVTMGSTNGGTGISKTWILVGLIAAGIFLIGGKKIKW